MTLTFIVSDRKAKEPLPYSFIWLTSLPKDSILVLTDMNGKAIAKTKKSTKEIKIHIFSPGYKQVFYTIKADSCKDFRVTLMDCNNYIIENGIVWKYKIKGHGSSKLVLVEDNVVVTLNKRKN